MDWLINALSSTGLSAIIGFASGLITKRLELKQAVQDMNFKIKMRELDLKEAEHERGHELHMADKMVERAQVEGEIKVEALEVGAFQESQKSNKVDGFLRWVRPGITFYMLLASSALFAVVWDRVGGLSNIPKAELIEMLMMMISASTFLTVLCVSWWFGSRGGNIFKAKK